MEAYEPVKPRPAAFLDRDGVLNHDTGYAHNYRDDMWMVGAAEAVRLLNQRGYWVFVITNQSGVSRGLFTERKLKALHARMELELLAQGASIDAWEYAINIPNPRGGNQPQVLRKPGVGMIRRLQRRFPIRMRGSFIIDNSPIMKRMAPKAGCPVYIFKGGDLLSFVESCLENVHGR